MADWLSKAHATITGGRIGSDDFQPFERQCVCGEILCGERTQIAQQIGCPQCDRTWFVLPRDPYPRAKTHRSKTSLWQRWARPSSAGKETANASSLLKGPGISKQTTSIASDPTRELPKRVPTPPMRQRVAVRIAATKAATRERLRKAARPMRLIAAGMLVALFVTGLWLWHRARIDAASATLVSLEPQAEQALAERDFSTAEKHFAQLATAVDTLGATDQTAQRVHQRYREIVVLNNLAAQSPYDLAAEVEKLASNPNEWSTRFEAISAGRWVVLDVNVTPAETVRDVAGEDENEEKSEADKPPEDLVVFDLPLVVGRTPVRFEMNASLFKRLKLPARAIFAVQYESWRLERDGKNPSVWVVRFNSDSAFLWASGDTYAALGFDLEAPAAPPGPVLEHQAKMLGLNSEPERQSARATPQAARK